MNVLKLLFLSTLFLGGLLAKAESSSINFQEPPFWMMTYDEFHQLQDFQKDFYSRQLLLEVKKLGLLNSPKEAQMKEAGEWAESWLQIQTSVYRACQSQDNLKTCKKLASARLKTFELAENQKWENRKARASHSETSSD